MIIKEHFVLLSKFGLALAMGSSFLAWTYGGVAVAQAVMTDLVFPAAILTSWLVSRKTAIQNPLQKPSVIRLKLHRIREQRK